MVSRADLMVFLLAMTVPIFLDPRFVDKFFCQKLQFLLVFEWNLSSNITYHSLVTCLAMQCIDGDRNRLLMPQASAKYQLLPWSDCFNELFYDASALLKCI